MGEIILIDDENKPRTKKEAKAINYLKSIEPIEWFLEKCTRSFAHYDGSVVAYENFIYNCIDNQLIIKRNKKNKITEISYKNEKKKHKWYKFNPSKISGLILDKIYYNNRYLMACLINMFEDIQQLTKQEIALVFKSLVKRNYEYDNTNKIYTVKITN